jgi:hypothetical protein
MQCQHSEWNDYCSRCPDYSKDKAPKIWHKRHLKYDTKYKQYENRSNILRLGPSSGTANTERITAVHIKDCEWQFWLGIVQGFWQIFLGYDGSTGEARSMSAEDAKSDGASGGIRLGGPPPEKMLAKNVLEAISRHLDALFWDCSMPTFCHFLKWNWKA